VAFHSLCIWDSIPAFGSCHFQTGEMTSLKPEIASLPGLQMLEMIFFVANTGRPSLHGRIEQ
jgi:hypothetical protein